MNDEQAKQKAYQLWGDRSRTYRVHRTADLYFYHVGFVGSYKDDKKTFFCQGTGATWEEAFDEVGTNKIKNKKGGDYG